MCLAVAVVLVCAVFCVCGGKGLVPIGVIGEDEDGYSEVAARNAVIESNNTLDITSVNIRNKDMFKTGHIVCDMAAMGIHAILGPDSARTNEIVRSVAENLGLPQFQTFPNAKMSTYARGNPHENLIFNLYPDPKIVAKALATLVREMHWKGFTVVYEDDDSLVMLQEVLKMHRSQDYPVVVRKLRPGNDQRSLLKEIKAKLEAHIVLVCHVDRILEILQQAAQVNLVEEYNSYILSHSDTHTLNFSKIKNLKANITTFRFVQVDNVHVMNTVKYWELYERMQHHGVNIPVESIRLSTALLYDALNVFLSVYGKLTEADDVEAVPLDCDSPTASEFGTRVAQYIKNHPVYDNGSLGSPMTGPLIFDQFGRRTEFSLQIVELNERGFRVTGRWNSSQPNIINSTITHKERQEEILQKKVIRVVSRIGEPYLMMRRPQTGVVLEGNDMYEGYIMDLITEIAKFRNFTFRFYIVDNNAYGKYDPKSKEWSGLIGELLSRKADLAVCDFTITYERGQAVDFSTPFMTLGISILYSKAVKKPPELLSFMLPLSLDVWLYMATAYLAMSFMIYVAARLAPSDWENPHPCNEEPEELENIWTIKNSLWLTLGSIMAQGCDILPKGISTRMIAGMWWFFSLIITSSYTANLAAFLTMERMGPTIENAEDLAKQTNIKYGCVRDGATAAFFKNSNFSTYQRMWRQMQTAEPSVFESSNKEGVERVKSSKRMYAFLMESTNIDYEMERDCNLMQVGAWLDIKGYGIAMPVNSDYRTSINEAILKMQEDGTLRRLKEKWWKEKNGGGMCNETKHLAEDSATELGVDHVGGVFVVLAGGIAFAFLIAVCEFLWNIRKISVKGQVPPKDALVSELKFAMSVSVRRKAVFRKADDSLSRNSKMSQ